MKTTFKLLVITLVCFFNFHSGKAQQVKPILENEKQMVYKINAYTDDSDKLLHKPVKLTT